MEQQSLAHRSELVPANINLGAMVKLSLPVLIRGFERNEWQTIRGIREQISYPSASIPLAIRRLNSLYIPNSIQPITTQTDEYVVLLESSPHPTDTVKKGDLNVSVDTYRLSEPGFVWSEIAISALKKNRDRDFRIRSVTGVLMREDL